MKPSPDLTQMFAAASGPRWSSMAFALIRALVPLKEWLAQRGQDDTGVFVTWLGEAVAFSDQPVLRNWNDTSEGKIYSGKPAAGDYVPLDSVGLDYQSPGYASGAVIPTRTDASSRPPGR